MNCIAIDGFLLDRKGEMNQLKQVSYKYKKDDGNTTYLYKFHIDDHPSFMDECMDLPFGGHLSIRKPINEKAKRTFTSSCQENEEFSIK